MNNLRNRVQLIGHLGNDPEIKHFDQDKLRAKVSIATNETYRNQKGELTKETHWHQLVAWGRTAQIMEKFLAKGSEVCVQGKLVSRSYNDSDGNIKYITEIVVNEILMLGSKAA